MSATFAKDEWMVRVNERSRETLELNGEINAGMSLAAATAARVVSK